MQTTCVLTVARQREVRQRPTEKTPRRGGGRVTVEAEAGATGPQPRNRGWHHSCKERGRPLPQDLPRRQGPAHTLILDIWPPEPGENKCLWFEVTQHMVLCNDGSRKRGCQHHAIPAASAPPEHILGMGWPWLRELFPFSR